MNKWPRRNSLSGHGAARQKLDEVGGQAGRCTPCVEVLCHIGVRACWGDSPVSHIGVRAHWGWWRPGGWPDSGRLHERGHAGPPGLGGGNGAGRCGSGTLGGPGSVWAAMLDGVAASGGCGPGHGAWGGLFQRPAACLLDLMVMATQWPQIAQARSAALVVGHGVVEVGVAARPRAAGISTGGLAGLDQVPQRGRGLVGGRFPGVVAVAAAQPGEGEGPPVASGTR